MRQIILALIFITFQIKFSIPIKKTSLSVLLSRNNCTTPNGENGRCTYVYLCKPILDILPGDRSPLSKEVLKVITSYMCSENDKKIDSEEVDNRNLKVCCPKQPISIEDDDEIGFYPPDVTHHKNLKLLPKYCGISEDMFRITGGYEAALFEFTWMAQLLYKTGKGNQFQCGGTVINEWYILTAAHCVSYLKNKTLTGVRVGDFNLSTDEDCEFYAGSEPVCADSVQDIGVKEVIIHPNFNYVTLINDIALIRVSEKMKMGQNNISPICLPIYKNLQEINLDRAVVTGWGKDDKRKNSKILRKVGMTIIDHYKCRQIYYKFRMILSHLQVCAGEEGKDACDGDSGGPLQAMVNYNGHMRYVQFGIISYGPADCGRRNRPGIYVNIIYYVKWILDNIKK